MEDCIIDTFGNGKGQFDILVGKRRAVLCWRVEVIQSSFIKEARKCRSTP